MVFKNEVSWMDILALLGAMGACALVFFDVKTEVGINARDILTTAKEVSEVEEELHGFEDVVYQRFIQLDSEIAQDRKEVLEAINGTRKEAESGRRRIEDKLDRLIEKAIP